MEMSAFQLIQELAQKLGDHHLGKVLQNIATIHCSGAHWTDVSEDEMIEALKKEMRIK